MSVVTIRSLVGRLNIDGERAILLHLLADAGFAFVVVMLTRAIARAFERNLQRELRRKVPRAAAVEQPRP